MTGNTRNLEIVIKARDDASKELSKMDGFLKRNQANFKKMAVVGTAALVGIGVMVSKAISASSDLSESVNAVNVVFGEAADGILALSEASAKTVGLSSADFNSLAVQFSNFADTVAGGGGDVVKVMDELTVRASDFASVMNLEVNEAAVLFQSGLAGQTEPLRRYGIDLSAAAVKNHALAAGIIDVDRELTEVEKVQSRYSLLMQSTDKTMGDFANTSGELANRQRILKAQFTNMSAQLGDVFVPILEKVLDVVAPMLDRLQEWIEKNPILARNIIIATAAIAGLVATAGLLGLVLPILIKGFGFLTIAVKGVSTALKFLMANPILLFIAAIAAGITYLAVKFGGLKNAFAVIGAGLVVLGNLFVIGFKEIGNFVVKYINIWLEKGNKVYNFFADMINNFGGDVRKLDLQIPEMDISANVAKIDEMGAFVQQLQDNANSAKTEVDSMSDSISNIPAMPVLPEIPTAVGEGADALNEKFKDLKVTIDDVGQKISEVTDKMNELTGENRQQNISFGVDVGTAFVEQEKKIADLQAQFNSEKDAVQKEKLRIELLREQEALASRKNWEIVYLDEVTEARRRASLTDFERIFEDLRIKKAVIDDEFNMKMSALKNELQLEVAKFDKLKELEEKALIDADKFLAQGEIQTLNSVNTQIGYYNKLAEAKARANRALTSGLVALNAGTSERASSSSPVVNVNISGNTIAGAGGLDELATKVGNAITGQLNLNGIGI